LFLLFGQNATLSGFGVPRYSTVQIIKPLNLHVHGIPAHDFTSWIGYAIPDGRDIETEVPTTPAVQTAVTLFFLATMFPLIQ